MSTRLLLPVALALTLTACASAGSAPMISEAPIVVDAVNRGAADPQDVGGLTLGPLPEGRQLVRTGRVSIVVDAFDPFSADLDRWLGAHGGFVADTDLSRYEGRVGYATLRIRVPATELDTLVGWTREKVEVEHLSITTQDVTAQWVDQDARLAAGRQTETRLLQLMAEQTGTLADVLAAERELARVRADLESLERQHRALGDQVSLASLTLDVRVTDPLTSHVSQSLGADAANALAESLGLMKLAARSMVVLAAALLPWFALLLTPLLALAGLLRFLLRRT